jgi:circadian clock protein KaiC
LSISSKVRIRMPPPARKIARVSLSKVPTGIEGFDEITGGGLPRGRTTLVCGGAGCGKTIFAVGFLVQGAVRYGEPGVCIEFEEAADKLSANVRSLGFDLQKLVRDRKLFVDHVHVERTEVEESGAYNLDGLFIRLSHAVATVRAKRVVLDSLESLFAGLSDAALLRSEIHRLFHWLDEHHLTAIVTAEAGDSRLTSLGIEEYLADCVISLDHRVNEQFSIRRLRVVKYRGSFHGTDEYPYIIDADGISVLPITSLELSHTASNARASSGIPALDEMLGGKGFFRGSSILVSGTAGTGKSSIAARFASSACARGENCLYFAFEESRDQIIRNMRSVGVDFQPWIRKRLLHFHAVRPSSAGLEGHLVAMQKLVKQLRPKVVVVDPITSIVSISGIYGVRSMLIRLVDFLKVQQITSMFTSLTFGSNSEEMTEEGVSSLMDTWIVLSDSERGGGRKRGLYIVKSRGMAHSHDLRELVVKNKRMDLGGVLTDRRLFPAVQN